MMNLLDCEKNIKGVIVSICSDKAKWIAFNLFVNKIMTSKEESERERERERGRQEQIAGNSRKKKRQN